YLYLIRHGQTDANVKKIYQGNSNVPLNESGKEQAKIIAWRFKGYPIKALYSSDLERALETARAINQYHDLDLFIERDLQEISLGEWQGKTRDQVKSEYGDFIQQRRDNDDIYTTAVPGGESYQMLERRAMDILNRIVSTSNYDHVAIVTHGGIIKSIVGHILDLPHEKRNAFDVYNTSITVLKYSKDKNRFKIKALNDTAHLE
ncbi:MAG: histidine phosphatase family protein, partial [Bacillota bacterium]